MGKLCIIIK
jgi:hypothetical protein